MLRRPVACRSALRCLRLDLPRLRLCLRVPASTPLPTSRDARPSDRGLGTPVCPVRHFHVGTTGTPRFLEDPCAHALLFDPGGTATSDRLQRIGAAFRINDGVGSHDRKPFGAQSHGLCTGCLRFAAGDCFPTTQDSLPAAGLALPDGIGYPSSPLARFSQLLHLTPPCPGFAWRTINVLGKRPSVRVPSRDVLSGCKGVCDGVFNRVSYPG